MKKQRLITYDIFRGILVLAMIIYHVFVNFYSPEINQYISLYRISIGFVFISGIITGQFLLEKKEKRKSIIRKLLGIYFLINLAALFFQGFSRTEMISTLLSGKQNLTSLEILLPIGLTLLLGPYITQKSKHSALKTTRSVVLLLGLLLILDQYGMYIFSINFTIYGLLGVTRSSYHNLEKETTLRVKSPITKRLIAIATIGLTFYIHHIDHTHVFTPIIHTLLIYISTVIVSQYISPSINKQLKNIGKHSFVIYIAHIIILKLLSYSISIEQSFLRSSIITIVVVVLSSIYAKDSTQTFIKENIRRGKK